MAQNLQKAVFAGGCFWCTEAAFDEVEGVVATVSGYTGGQANDANYDAVSTGRTTHFEALEATYDVEVVSYETLLEAFWESIDPFDEHGQFADKGPQYQTAIFYGNEAEKQLAEQSKAALAEKFGKNIATQILPASEFFAAEIYHQDYHKKNKVRYQLYKHGSGRVKKLQEIWGE